MRKLSISTILMLGLVAAVGSLISWGLALKEEKTITETENSHLNQQLASFQQFKAELQDEVDILMVDYGKVAKENTILKKLLHNSKKQLVTKNYEYVQFRMESTTTHQSLKENMQRLVKAKSALESTIKETSQSNEALLKKSGFDKTVFQNIVHNTNDSDSIFQQLTSEYELAKTRRFVAINEAKYKKIKANQKPRPTSSKILRATNFRTETEMRNGKVTAKAKRVKRVVVSFDVNDVPSTQWGEQNIYLVLKDGKHKVLNPKFERVKVNKGGLIQEIRVASTEQVNLKKQQRVRFKFDVANRLEPGYYEAEVYAKSGLLGKVGFRVDR